MLRRLDEKEIALIRMGIWPCCGEREVQGGPRGGMMRNLRCPNCGTVVNIPAFKTSTEVMHQMCEMVSEPMYYDPEATMRRLEISHQQVKDINIIMSPAPYELRQQKKALRWARFPPTAKWVIKSGLTTMTAMLVAVTCWPGSIPERVFSMAFTALAGLLILVMGLRRFEHKGK